ncbi:hypothetical protein VNO78_12432 [Psophocarpus tetragonolobus]|uniref:GH18 domain-containing protein n=1 Tax=Psophocarpus tetragonolobus TaxID=3891 RepID=A0AAN9SPW5_PSOTE
MCNWLILLLNMAFLAQFGHGQTPQLIFGRHYDPYGGNCSILGRDIRKCQKQGIQVMLSIGGSSTSYSLASFKDAKNVSDYLWHNFLGGSNNSSLGDAILDGIDFVIVVTLVTQHWEDLAHYLKTHRRNVYLSATPQCVFPDSTLGKIFLGLSAASSVAPERGYISPDLLITQILSTVKLSSNYEGIMLWSSEVRVDAVERAYHNVGMDNQDFDFYYFIQQWPGSYCDTQNSCCYPTTGKLAADFDIRFDKQYAEELANTGMSKWKWDPIFEP